MKTIDLHAEVNRIVGKYFPALVARELLKLRPQAKPIVVKPIERKVNQYMPPAKTLVPKAARVEPARVTSYRDALARYGSRVAAAKACGVAETTFRDRLKREQDAAKPARQDNASGPGN